MQVNMSIIGANASERDQNDDSLINACAGVKSSISGKNYSAGSFLGGTPDIFSLLYEGFLRFLVIPGVPTGACLRDTEKNVYLALRIG